ncbi:MAG: 4-hydroxy-3-methylbut-2-enyl diphosphate reductase [Bacteroidota bacterium]|nr:4-hydroxy-3-methylbut-2-enyl diphosphate reductase [Bacteroidota bacterium]
MKSFEVPIIYRSPLISAIKKKRKEMDKMKKDFTPTLLDFGPVQVFLARHFGFCYGVENAIEIAFRTVEENPGKRIFLLSEMIHNPQVNADLESHGIKFLQDTYGKQLVSFDELNSDDIVIIPAFGTTLEIEKKLYDIGIPAKKYNTTCPFVEKVWNRGEAIAKDNYTIVIHGKPDHEETRATFSRAAAHAPSVVIKDIKQAQELAKYITGEKKTTQFYSEFNGQYSEGFHVERDLGRIGVVNQTTMLATDTQAIADFLKQIMIRKYGNNAEGHFADTRDTLCYATNDNQSAVTAMLETKADLAIVVGGYNSSNTSHLVELCEEKLPTYFISNEDKILSRRDILHYDFHIKQEILTSNYLPRREPVKILVTSGASCPDAIVEVVIKKIISFYPAEKNTEQLTGEFQ